MISIDLNCDLGEGADDEPLYSFITSANIACGGHAGDDVTMQAAVRSALRHGVAVGAHPGYPDRAGFGRVVLPMPAAEVAASVCEQVLSLSKIAAALGCRLRHVKPHGALYHEAVKNDTVAEAIALGVARVDRDLVLVGLARAPMLAVWAGLGRPVAGEAFADRTYEPDGTLRPRRFQDALITDPQKAADQALRLAREGGVRTICVHSDTPHAVAILAAVHDQLKKASIHLRPLGGWG